MDFLQSIDSSNAILIALGCACLCGVLFVLMAGLQVVGGVLETFLSLFGMFFDVLSGGPVAWCGCLVAVLGCVGLVGLGILLTQALSTCGTPQAINFCSIIGQ